MTVCKKAIDIPPFLVMDVLERAKALEAEGHDVVHLEVGEPDFDTPEVIKQAAIEAMNQGHTHYTHSMGEMELRQAIADHYNQRYGVEVQPERIIVSSGTSPAMLILFQAILEEGDEVILSNPHYACYPNFISYPGGCPVYVEVTEDDGFQLRVEAVEAALTGRTKAILINSPSNPTGQLLSRENMARLAGLGKLIISDEIYHGLDYEERAASILEFTDNAVVFNGFSKLYAMTGWRLGYMIVPPELARPVQKIHQNFFISANSFVQTGGVAALKEAGPDTEKMVETYNARRKLLIARLKDLGFGIKVEPTGAFYVLANAKHLSNDSLNLAFDILEKAHVGCAPGIDFGSGAEGYLRFSYATSREQIEKGMVRLAEYLKNRQA